jgi:hypothetical protein
MTPPPVTGRASASAAIAARDASAAAAERCICTICAMGYTFQFIGPPGAVSVITRTVL